MLFVCVKCSSCSQPCKNYKKSIKFFQGYDHKCAATFLMNHSVYLLFSDLCIYNRYTIPFSVSILCSLKLLPSTKFKSETL